MKLLRQGLVLIICFHLAVAVMIGCATSHKVEFLNDACIKPYRGYEYRTCEAMTVQVDDNHFTVDKNFETNLASIPRVLWPIFAPQYSGFIAPSILHDYLYRCHTTVTRVFADEVLYSALLSQGVTRFTASKFYIAVRLFGWAHFNEHGGDC